MEDRQLEELLKSKDANLIYVPPNAFIQETIDFGGAEGVAAIFNVAGTALVHTVTASPLTLTFAGPVIEKIGFFGWEMLKAAKDKAKGSKETYLKLCKQRFGGGMANMITDICVHDPLYAGIMAYGLTHSQISPEVLSAVSFLAALPPAASLKHLSSELSHQKTKYYSKLKGFSWEGYYESRFLVGTDQMPERILEDIAKKFELNKSDTRHYDDIYYENSLKSLSGRAAVMRTRNTTTENGEKTRSLEVAYTLPKKKSVPSVSEYNYFYSRKEKGRKLITKQEDAKEVKPFGSKIKTATQEISFTRSARYDRELRVALDNIPSTSQNGKSLYIMELKVYGDTQKLCEAMDYLMRSYRVRTTTQPKSVLLKTLDEL